MNSRFWWSFGVLASTLVVMALGAPFLAPYSPRQQFREVAQAPPSAIHFRTEDGAWAGPFVRRLQRVDLAPTYAETPEAYPIQMFVEGAHYSILGLPANLHLFGLQGRAGLFLLGTDELGRDVFSRLLFALRYSLGIALCGITAALLVGVLLGTVAGYWGGWLDWTVMRAADLFLSFPALFLVLGLRALFPQLLSAGETFWLIVAIFGVVGWASIARVVRGQVLSLKTRDYVDAARSMGATDWWLLSRHILPGTRHFLLVQVAVLLPSFVLGEVTLSFLGVGVQEPDASLGTLLTAAASVRTLSSHPWLLSPAALLLATVFGLQVVAERLKSTVGGVSNPV